VELPDEMPEGCNFYGLLRTSLAPETIARRFVAAGWSIARVGDEERLEVGWGRLVLRPGDPVAVQGWLDRPDERVGAVLGVLGDPEIDGVYQWINAEGRLWRELPFDESMLDPDDPRLPPEIRQSIRAHLAGSPLAPASRKPWWRFW
jgi:hypothetical protein